MSGADSLTVLTTRGPLATKRITLLPGATRPIIEAYGRAAVFSISERPVFGIDDLTALLCEIEERPTSFVVRATPVAGVDRHYAKRRLHPRRANDGRVEPATLAPAARHWIALDCDGIGCPEGIDPVHDIDSVVEHVVSRLPFQFRDATCWWQFTSSHGLKPGINLRLFFWADRPLADWQLKYWLADSPVDRSIFAPAQPIYVARPIFIGMPDPVPYRSGIWRGDRDAITPPVIEKSELRATATRQAPPRSGGSGYEYYRSKIGDHGAGDGFYAPVKSAVAAWIARQGGGDIALLRADLERAIRAAPRDVVKHNNRYIEFRVGDLDTLTGAILERQAAREGQPTEPCEPTYPAPLASVAETRATLATVMDRFAATALAYQGALSAVVE